MEYLDTARAELLLRQAEGTNEAFLNALTDEICILDGAGRIVAVNEAWKRTSAQGGEVYVSRAEVGENYLDVCRSAGAAGLPEAEQALQGVTAVLRKSTETVSLEYERNSEMGRQWFRLTVTALSQLPGALLSHRDITARRKVEEALRLSGEVDPKQFMSPFFESFLPSLVKNLAIALNTRQAFVTEVLDHTGSRVRLLGLWSGEGFGELFAYETAGTPCAQALSGRTTVFPSGLQKLFPDDEWFRVVGAESYIAVPLIDSSGKVMGHLGAVDDKPLTDAPFAETTLKVFASRATPELERQLLARRHADQAYLIDNAPDAIVGTNQNLEITYWNKSAEKLYGWPAGEAIGRHALEVMGTQPASSQAVRAAVQEGGFRGEITQMRRDGSVIEVDATVMAFRGPDGEASGLISINRDITERKQVELALQQSERENEAILQAIPDMMFRMDGDGTFLDFKPARDIQPLIPSTEFLGKRVQDVMPGDLGSKLYEAIQSSLRTSQTLTVNYQLVEEGLLRDYEARLIPTGENEVLSIIRDYTGSKQQAGEASSPGRSLVKNGYVVAGAVRRPGDKPKILVVDQDVQALRFLRRALDHSSRRPIVTSDPEEAVRLAELETPDLVLLDLMLPGEGSFELFREIRQTSPRAAIIVMVPGDREEEAVEALRIGAEDYIRKPILPAEMDARIEAALRRNEARNTPEAELIELGDLVIDASARQVTVAGKPVELTPTEYKLLLEMAQSAGRVLTHHQILDRVWGSGYTDDHELLRSFIRSLRRKLGDHPDNPKFLRSERGVGYRLLNSVKA
jgi:PAS domain S-box-containing protein